MQLWEREKARVLKDATEKYKNTIITLYLKRIFKKIRQDVNKCYLPMGQLVFFADSLCHE